MNITAVIIAAVIVGGTGLFIGVFLGLAGKKFAVEVDEREEAILGVLPGNNCGGCGYAAALLQQLQREKRKLEAVRSEVHQSQPRLVRLWECLQASRSMK